MRWALAALWLLHAAPLTADELVYSGSRLLLENHVTGNELEIHWRCFASADSVEKVAAHYQKDARLEVGPWRKEEGERGFAAKADPGLHVAVFSAEVAARRPTCKAELKPGERTVVQISKGIARPPATPKTPR
jgi:hypothetical protein